MKVVVIPLKNGNWRFVRMTDARHVRWRSAWATWFERSGKRLLVSPEMWQEKGIDFNI